MGINARNASRSSVNLLDQLGIAIPGTQLAFVSASKLAADLDNVVASGIRWLRFDIAWTEIEGTQGSLYWNNIDRIVTAAQSRNLKLIGIITTMAPWARPNGMNWQYGPSSSTERTNFANFAQAVATRYSGKFHAYEIWNEPNLDQFWYPTPSSSNYASLLIAASNAIRSVDTKTLILTGGTGGSGGSPDIISTTFVSGIYSAGAKNYFDGVAVHPYTNLTGQMDGEMARALQIRTVMNSNGDQLKPIYATEAGAPTAGSGPVISESAQAALVRKYHDYWMTNFSPRGPLFWYTLNDTDGTDRENNFGILRTDGSRKPAFGDIQQSAIRFI